MLGLVAAVAASGCGGDGGGGGSDGGGSAIPEGDYPCEIEVIVRDYCLQCHGDPLRGGATVRLDRWGDMHVPARSDASRKVYEVSLERLNDPDSPMPPLSVTMPDSARNTLAAWLRNGAPKRPAGESCGASDGGAGG